MYSLPLKLPPGSDLRQSIEQIGKDQNAHGFVLGVVGNLSRAAFQCPGHKDPTVLEGNLEIITLNGTFSPNGVHLHLSLSDGACQVWGGHLEEGTLVLKGADVLVGLLDKPFSEPQSNRNINPEIDARLEIAVLPGCPWSSRALRILKNLDVPFKVEIIDSEESFNNLRSRSDLSTFPQVFIDGELIGGYEAIQEFKSSGRFAEFQ